MPEVNRDVPEELSGASGASITVERDPAGVRVRVVGELDISTASELERVLDGLAVAHPGRLLLDLDCVEFMDSTGLAAVVGAHNAAELNGHRLTVRYSSSQVQRLFELTGMLEAFTRE